MEEQFYLVWPALLIVFMRRSHRRFAAWALPALILGSLAACEIFRQYDASAVFYLMPFRVFELAIGGAFVFVPSASRPQAGIALQVVGLSMIAASVVFLDNTMPMPGPISLAPCVGTVLVIVGGRSAPMWVLRNAASQLFGRLSYPLYLVHWPLVVFFPITLRYPLAYMGVCAALAAALHFAVERPAKQFFNAPRWPNAPMTALMLASLTVMVSATVFMSAGWKFRLAPEIQAIPAANKMWADRNPTVRVYECFLMEHAKFTEFRKASCLAMSPDKPNVIVVGDSFAADLHSALAQAFPGVNFLQATSGNCKPILDNRKGGNCQELLDYVFEEFIPNNHLDGIVLEANWGYGDVKPILATLTKLKKGPEKLVLAGAPVRYRTSVPTLLFEAGRVPFERAVAYARSQRHPVDPSNTLVRNAVEEAGFKFLDLHEMMCSPACELFTPTGDLIVLDFGHLTKIGATYLAAKLARSKLAFLRRQVR